MPTRYIDGRQFARQADGTWAPTHYQRQLDQDAAERKARLDRQAELQRNDRQVARRAYHPRPCGADFATGLVLGALIF